MLEKMTEELNKKNEELKKQNDSQLLYFNAYVNRFVNKESLEHLLIKCVYLFKVLCFLMLGTTAIALTNQMTILGQINSTLMGLLFVSTLLIYCMYAFVCYKDKNDNVMSLNVFYMIILLVVTALLSSMFIYVYNVSIKENYDIASFNNFISAYMFFITLVIYMLIIKQSFIKRNIITEDGYAISQNIVENV